MRIKSYDIIRVISLLMIIIAHVMEAAAHKYGFEPWMNPFFLGGIGVTFFIILSGCSLGFSTKKSPINLFNFYKKRASSIYPFYWLAYAITAAFFFITQSFLPMGTDIKTIAITLFALDGYLNSTHATYYLIGEWFTGFILLTYLISPFFIKGAKKRPLVTLLIAIMLSYLSVTYTPTILEYTSFWNKSPLWNPTSRLAEFTFGILISTYILYNRPLFKYLALAAAAYLILMLVVFNSSYYQFTLIGISLWASTFTVGLYLLTLLRLERFKLNILDFLSTYSFMAFLFHHQIAAYIVNHTNFAKFTHIHLFYAFICTTMISYALAYIFHKPAIAIQKALFTR